METAPLDIGCSVTGIDAAKATKTQINKLRDLLYRNRLIVLKDQNLDEAAYCEFAQSVGNPVPYLQDNYHHPEFPLIFVSSNVKKEGKQIGVARTGGYWHSDTSFEKDPKFITMLMPKVLPKTSPAHALHRHGRAVYEASRRQSRTGWPVTSSCIAADALQDARPGLPATTSSRSSPTIDQASARPCAPASSSTPTPRKRCSTATAALRSPSPMLARRVGRPAETVFDFAETQRFIREVQWSMGDVIIWDNRFLLTARAATQAPRKRR